MDFKRAFLQVLIASLVATAALAIGFLLLADFNDRTWKVIGTTALLSGFSLLGLPGAALLDQGRAVVLGWTNLALAAAGLVWALYLLWTEADNGWKPLVVLVAFGGAAAQASGTTARRRDDDPPSVHVLYLVGIVGGLILATLVTVAALEEIDSGGFYRVVGALAVAELLVILLQPILRRTGRRDVEDADADVAPISLSVGLADGREVAVERREKDFAAAVAGAIRELEGLGAEVVRVERR